VTDSASVGDVLEGRAADIPRMPRPGDWSLSGSLSGSERPFRGDMQARCLRLALVLRVQQTAQVPTALLRASCCLQRHAAATSDF
jgi:hypothetical protein